VPQLASVVQAVRAVRGQVAQVQVWVQVAQVQVWVQVSVSV
jgi:hypothetical protein